jgi:hypothetical protein
MRENKKRREGRINPLVLLLCSREEDEEEGRKRKSLFPVFAGGGWVVKKERKKERKKEEEKALSLFVFRPDRALRTDCVLLKNNSTTNRHQHVSSAFESLQRSATITIADFYHPTRNLQMS